MNALVLSPTTIEEARTLAKDLAPADILPAEEYVFGSATVTNGASGEKTAAPAGPPAEVRVPFGRNKGRLLSETDDKDVLYLLKFFTQAAGDRAKSRFKESNEASLRGVEAEVSRRRLQP